MFKHAFKSGTAVPKSAAYWVHHYQHRISHLAFIEHGGKFPACARCGERVRFELALDQTGAELITLDVDFPRDDEAAAG